MVDEKRIARIGLRIRELETRDGEVRLFHCCHDFDGNKLVVENRPPNNFKKNNEPDKPRLCVSRSVPQAFAAMCKGRKMPLFVYEADCPSRAIECHGVKDAPLTSERWLLPGDTLTRISALKTERVLEVIRRTFNLLDSISSPTGTDARLASIVAACEVLDDHFVTTGLEALLRTEIEQRDATPAA